ncbi:HlyD family secretion protein [Pseudomonas nicosulfuronedens]|uniref:HlyD family secretion protein n=1 Tax=Pseudomonas nicosulfuronedens TaxID=2571105 RepID=UPI00244D60C6|nr:HlyD family secretion protein [Pseudomonas nicosulfuronedens]MDH1011918.1 HlyD family secretion protein [Pseudomonas nicosulfuronedens]MDH1981626.1 HlyD family secretion protein [Pseudomonas nicosulfuronedens]MDH2027960.1 HlyD family secretion protein [Pseudomonas nicosulfuronedens]
MSDTPATPPAPPAPPIPGKSAPDRGMRLVLLLIVVSLVWYLLADRFTPYTQQARLQAYVVPVSAEVAGPVKRVAVGNNQEVRKGEVLVELDQEQYRIALQRAEADLETVRRQIGASTAGIDSALASLAAAQANERKTRQDAERLQRLYQEDPGTVSVRRLESAQATREQAASQVAAARAEVERAREQQGGHDEDNAQLRSATANVAKARLDLARTTVRADSDGLITDLRTDVGHYVGPGSPVMTLIAIHDLWISADMTENNLGHLRNGTPVLVVLDALPGELLKGRIRSIGYGVSVGQGTPPGSLPTVQNSREWLRSAQRFPVIVELDRDQLKSPAGLRVGGQAEVMALPSEGNPLNLLGRTFMWLMSWLSYAY